MSAKSILTRYVLRSDLPRYPREELRRHLASVASRDGLVIDKKELDKLASELVVMPNMEQKPKKAKKRRVKDDAK